MSMANTINESDQSVNLLSAYIKAFGEIPHNPTELVDYSDGKLNFSDAQTVINVYKKNLNDLRSGKVSYCPRTTTHSSSKHKKTNNDQTSIASNHFNATNTSEFEDNIGTHATKYSIKDDYSARYSVVIDYSLDDRTLEKQLLQLSKSQLIKECKLRQVTVGNRETKKKMIKRLIKSNWRGSNKKNQKQIEMESIEPKPNKTQTIKCNSCCLYFSESYPEQYPFHCQHPYCIKCCAELINKSLSLSNAIPRCLKCDNTLNINNIHQKIQSLLLPKYQITIDFAEYNDIDHLIRGYIRRQLFIIQLQSLTSIQVESILEKKQINIKQFYVPTEIVLSIFDFYKLIYCKKKACPDCLQRDNKLILCVLCRNNRYIKCKTCNKTGKVSSYKTCGSCDGSGKGRSADTVYDRDRTKCSSCDGHGCTYAPMDYCMRCSGSGYISVEKPRTVYESCTCIRCNGLGKVGTFQQCESCNGNGMVLCIKCKCKNCEGNKYLLLPHINKICNKQLLCYKCNNYLPQNMLLFLNNCHHSFCFECCSQYIKTELNYKRIANCLVVQCKNEKKSIFKIFGEEFSSSLHKRFIEYNTFYCVICHNNHDNELLFEWNGCGHQYGINCATKYILDYPQLSKDYNKIIPQCAQPRCTRTLNKTDAELVGFHYDYYKRKYNNHKVRARITVTTRRIIWLAITGSILYGASLVFMKAKDMRDYTESFTNKGNCILIESHQDTSWKESSSGGFGRRLLGTTYHNVYTYQIYNGSSNDTDVLCGQYRNKQPLGKNYTLNRKYPNKKILKYEINNRTDLNKTDYVIPCYTNKYCDDILLDVEYHFKDYRIDGCTCGCFVFCGILVVLIACGCFGAFYIYEVDPF